MTKCSIQLAGLCLAVALLAGAARAQDNLELGKMWTFENIPTAYFEREHGFAPTQEWLDAVRLSSLKYGGGCSASFVSPQGLIMTNHHCARGDIAKASPAGEDWVKDGFVAQTLADEVPLSDLAVEQLVAMREVTAEVNEGVNDDDDDATAVAKRNANIKKIEAMAKIANPTHRPAVTALYQGGMYQLYEYRVFDDLRLVVAPHLQTAHFGGDPDNFTYPRWGIDFTFVRAYVDDKPFDSSAHYFKFKPAGAVEGESVFVPGNPGSTNRLMTLAELEYNRDTYAPILREHIEILLGYFDARIAANPESKQSLLPQVLRFENGRKAWGGYHGALLDDSFMEQKTLAEEIFRAKVSDDPELDAKYGSAWDEIAGISEAMAIEMRANRVYRDLENPLIARAVALVMSVSEEFPAAVREGARKNLGFEDLAPISGPELVQATMWLDHARVWADDDNAYLAAIMPDLEPEAALAAFYEASEIDNGNAAKALMEGGAEAVVNSQDVALVAARALLAGQKMHQGILQKLNTRLEAQKTRIGQAVFAVYGTSVSPDATGTMRLSDGKVEGFPMNGTIAPWKTSFYSLYGRNVEFNNEYPFDLPQPWLDKRDRIDMSQPVDFCSTNDIIGGNSGSVIINQQREAVGLIFDGNIEMLGNNYMYRGDIPRAVSVHAAAIIEAISKIYEANRLTEELLAQ